MKRYFLPIVAGFFLFAGLSIIATTNVKAEGVYHNIGTPTGTNGSPDAVSWSTGNPLTVDAYGNYIAPIQSNSNVDYNLSFSNDKGTTWSEISGLNLTARVSLAYDNLNDKLLALSASGNGDVTFRRLIIKRDADYKITNVIPDTSFSDLILDSTGSCASASAANPIILNKNIEGTNFAFAFWSIRKDCGIGQEFTETRASILHIANDSTDGNVLSWESLTGGASPTSFGPAQVNFTTLYTTPSIVPNFQHSAIIADSGTNQYDIYYFNIDENDTHGFMRIPFNFGSNYWLNPNARVTFGGNVNDSQGYNLKRELLTKPVFAAGQDRVYVGIARWLDNTNGDTQSLFYVDASDNVSLAGDLYSSGGAHCIYPTLDISYDQVHDQVYSFYLTSGASNVCGHTDYKTFDGTTMSSASTFFSVDNRSVDIPITYPTRVDDRILLFFRVNNELTPGIPPHDIYFGYVGLDAQNIPNATVANTMGANNDESYYDFVKTCSTRSGVDVIGDSIGAIVLSAQFSDEFATPKAPYTYLNDGLWQPPSTWGAGTFNPQPNGQINVYSPNGAYILSRQQFSSPQIFQFRAKLSAYTFEHIGLANGEGFNKYAIFSTGNDGVLKIRTSNGSESNQVLGTSYFDDFHNYMIVWSVGTVTFYIDSVQVGTFNSDVPDEAMRIIISNNDHTAGADLLVDSVNTVGFPGLTGTYTSCPIDSEINDAEWTSATYSASLLAGQSVSFQVRTSTDGFTWSDWTSNLNNGEAISLPLGRYGQYKSNLATTNPNISPSLYGVGMNFQSHIAPDAVDDNVSTDQDIPFVIHLFANDLNIDNLDDTQTTLTSSALHGTANLVDAPNGGVFYTPNLGYSGTDHFTYEICDTYSICDSATVNVTINPVYVGPTGTNESASVTNNSIVLISVLTNDLDSDGSLDPSTLTVSVQPAHGVTSVNTTTGVITYTPNAGYTGSDSFIYNVCDNHSKCTTGTVTITVNAAVENQNTNNSNQSNNQNDIDLSSSILSCSDVIPLAPRILYANSQELTTLNVNFSASVDTFSNFEIQLTKVSGDYSNSDTINVDKNKLEYTFKNLSPATQYYIRLREKNGCVFSNWSDEFKATTSSNQIVSQSPVSAPLNSSEDKQEAQSSINPGIIIVALIPFTIIIGAIYFVKKKKVDDDY